MTRARIVRPPGELARPFVGVESEPLAPHDVPTATGQDDAGDPSTQPSEPGEPDPVAQAHERGLQQGLEQGRQEAQAEFEARATELQREVVATLERLSRAGQEFERERTAAMKRLALEAAMRIVRERIDADDPLAARALAQAVEALPAGRTLRVRLHADDLSAVESAMAAEIEAKRLELSASEEISRGGCVVESDVGTIDATLETAIETVTAAIDGNAENP